jgi:hypothetical protein
VNPNIDTPQTKADDNKEDKNDLEDIKPLPENNIPQNTVQESEQPHYENSDEQKPVFDFPPQEINEQSLKIAENDSEIKQEVFSHTLDAGNPFDFLQGFGVKKESTNFDTENNPEQTLSEKDKTTQRDPITVNNGTSQPNNSNLIENTEAEAYEEKPALPEGKRP